LPRNSRFTARNRFADDRAKLNTSNVAVGHVTPESDVPDMTSRDVTIRHVTAAAVSRFEAEIESACDRMTSRHDP